MKNTENLAIAMGLNYAALFCFIMVFITSLLESYIWFWLLFLLAIIFQVIKIIFDWKFIVGEYKNKNQ